MQSATPTAQWIRSGGFNPVQPTVPFSSTARVAPILNVMGEPGTLPAEDRSHYRSELFGLSAASNAQAGLHAQSRMSGAEACVWTLDGSTKNATLVAGLTINTWEPEGNAKLKARLVNHLEIAAYEWGYEYNVGTNIWLAFRNLVKPLTTVSALRSSRPTPRRRAWATGCRTGSPTICRSCGETDAASGRGTPI